MVTHAQILDAFPNERKERHRALSAVIGERIGTITAWHSRNSIPPRAWKKIVTAADEMGVDGVTLDALASAVSDAA